MTKHSESIEQLTGWRLCKYSSCRSVQLHSLGISDFLTDDYEFDKVTAGALLHFQRTQSLSGTPSMITFGEFLTPPESFLEINQDFTILPPQLFHFKESANVCENIWWLEISKKFNPGANLTVEVYNYGEVIC